MIIIYMYVQEACTYDLTYRNRYSLVFVRNIVLELVQGHKTAHVRSTTVFVVNNNVHLNIILTLRQRIA